MNGPEHYRKAERLLGPKQRERFGGEKDPYLSPPTQDEIFRGIGHALLAVAAATAANIRRNGSVPMHCADDWAAVIR